jgi:outer membrane lipoprotein SlyB
VARGAAVSWTRTATTLMSARSTSVDAETMAVAGGGGGGASVGMVDGSGCGRGHDLHVNDCVGDVVGAVIRDSGRVRLERVHADSRGRGRDFRRVVTLPF